VNQTLHGGLRDAQSHLNKMLSERDRGRNLNSSKQTLNQYLYRWLEVCAKPRLRPKSYQNYEGLLRRYVRPADRITLSRNLDHGKVPSLVNRQDGY
jgi:hypothetical protein